MTEQRFNQLLNEGALYHPLPMFIVTRLSLALASVTFTCGKQGADALEAYCEMPAPEKRDHGLLSSQRFNELLNGPLRGDGLGETIQRLAGALKYVVDTCKEFGELALESHCEDRERQDRHADGPPEEL